MADCNPCRVRHLRCDPHTPCSSCQSAGRDCLRGYNVRFRNLACPSTDLAPKEITKYEFHFEPSQVWVDTSLKLEFVDENESDGGDTNAVNTGEGYLSRPSAESLQAQIRGSTPTSPGLVLDSYEPAPSNLHEDSPSISYAIAPGDFDRLRASLSISIENDSIPKASQSAVSWLLNAGSRSTPSPPPAPFRIGPPQDISGRPLSSLKEARLLHHFVEKLGPWFDTADSKRHFTKIAPCMAASNPLLMNASLALSALQLSRISDHDPYDAVMYHDRCLKLMVPMLDDDDRIKDDSLLLTSVIFTLYEDLDVGGDSQRHIRAFSLFLPTHDASPPTPLRKAVFWVNLRQEIYAACINESPILADLSSCNVDPSFPPADDDTWVHRALWVCAQVLQWAFGADPSHAQWRSLNALVSLWEALRPGSFAPVFLREADSEAGRWFPEVCFASDEHVVGTQFVLLAKLLLTAHDPTVPRIGSRMKAAVEAMQEKARGYVRVLCGIALGNGYVPGNFHATLAIRICGVWFTDRAEQARLIAFLRHTEGCSGWPIKIGQRALEEDWGWRPG